MRRIPWIAAAIFVLSCAFAISTRNRARVFASEPRPAASNNCDRACLDGFVDQYLKALAAHDPSKLPLAKNVKFTEDGVELKPGDGLWATATGLGTYRLDFAEPEAGEAGAYALVQENGTPAILWLRLKVVKRQITEIETLVARKQTTSLLNTNNLTTPPPIFMETVREADRPSRAEMVSIVNKYFDGIEQGNGDIVPFDKDCVRIENGVQTCPGSASSRLGALSCGEQLSTKIFTYIPVGEPAAVSDRRPRARAGAGAGAIQSSGLAADGECAGTRNDEDGALSRSGRTARRSRSCSKWRIARFAKLRR